MPTDLRTEPTRLTDRPTPRQTWALIRASWTMALRARGVLFVMVASPLTMVVWALIRNVSFTFGSRSMDYLDFVIPGMAAFLAAHLFQDIVTAVAASYRARGILRRLAVTPVSPRRVIAAQLTPYLVFGLVNTALMLTVGMAVGAHIRLTADLLWVLPLAAAVVATGLCFAYAIAGFAPTPQTANAISSALALPLIFFTGVGYPLQALPAPLGGILQWAMPYAPLIRTIRGIALDGAGIGAYPLETVVGAAWLALAFTLAVLGYRFDRE